MLRGPGQGSGLGDGGENTELFEGGFAQVHFINLKATLT
jgi:hypothetical protein